MFDEFSSEEESSTIFESFSDVALCTLAVALLLLTLLAINITQNVNVRINRSTFSGGVMRPALHLECTVPDFSQTKSANLAVQRALFANTPYVAVHLFSPSLAMIATDVRGGGTVALGQDQTFAQQQDLSLYQFMQLAPGIDPGSFLAEGQPTALLLPSILDKQMVYEPDDPNGYRANANRMLTRHLLASVWPIYKKPIFPVRRPSEYSQAHTRIFVETQSVKSDSGEEHYIVIGHASYKLPDALDDGSLAWLGGFSSGLTEIVFLGDTWSDASKRTNKRIEFFRKNGFTACANAYREYAFPTHPDPAVEAIHAKLVAAGYKKKDIERHTRHALQQIMVSKALLQNRLKENAANLFPPLLAYPKAWAAYIDHYEKEQPDPPKWFYREFLDRLGFDRLTIERASR